MRAALHGSWVAAIAALVTALVALGGTAYSVIYTTSSEDNRSQTEFLRGQRQDLYARIVNQASAAVQVDNKLSALQTEDEVKPYVNGGRTVYTKETLALESSVGAVTIIGSPEVQTTMSEMVDAQIDYEEAVFEALVAKARFYEDNLEVTIDEVNDATGEETQRAVAAYRTQKAFFAAARVDVGNK